MRTIIAAAILLAATTAHAEVTLTIGIDVNADKPKVITGRGMISRYGYLSGSSLPDVCGGGMLRKTRAYFGIGMCVGEADPERVETEWHYDIIVGVVINKHIALEYNHKSNCRDVPLPCPKTGPKEMENFGHDIIGIRLAW